MLRSLTVAALAALPLCAQQVNVSQVKGLPFASSTQYNFTRTNGRGASGDLSSAGAGKTVALTPCPLGPNAATVENWYLRIADGTGTAETVKVTGGTCMSGAASGTVTFTTVNPHTGAWTLKPTMVGVLEANAAMCASGGGTIYVPAGIHTVYSRVELCGGVKLIGAGSEQTIFQVAASTWTQLPDIWVNIGNPFINVVVSTKFDVENFEIRGFTVDGNRSAQSGARPYSFPVSPMGSRNGIISDVVVRNFHAFGAGFGLIGPQSSNILISDSAVIGESDLARGECLGGFFVQGPDNTLFRNRTSYVCDDGFVPSLYRAKRTKVIGNTAISHAGNVAFNCEAAYDCVFVGNTAAGNWGACFGAGDLGEGFGNAIFDGNICKQHVAEFPQPGTSQGIPDNGFTGGAVTADLTVSGAGVTFSNNIIEGCEGRGVSIGGRVRNMNIVGNTIKGCIIGIDLNSEGATNYPVGVIIENNILDHNAVAGINFQNFTGPVADYFIVRGNLMTDTITPKVQPYGMTFNTDGSDIVNAIISDNLMSGNVTGGYTGLAPFQFKGVWSNNLTGGTDTGEIHTPGSQVHFGVNGGGLTFSQLGAASASTNGKLIYCKDCAVANPCAGSGTGAFAKGLNGAWVCN